MKVLIIANFNSHSCIELAYKCAKKNIHIDSIVFVGDREDYKSMLIDWDYTNFQIGMRIVDIEDLCLPVYFVNRLNSPHTIRLLKKLKPDVILQGGVGIIKKEIIETAKIGILNSHPGQLPDFQGCMAVEWSIYQDAPIGSTCHFIDEGIDSGPVILFEPMEVKKYMDYNSIRRKALSHRIDILIKGLEMVLQGFTVYDATSQGEGKYYKPLKEEEMQVVMDKINGKTYKYMVD